MAEKKSLLTRLTTKARKGYHEFRGESQELRGRVPHDASTVREASTGVRSSSLPPGSQVTTSGKNVLKGTLVILSSALEGLPIPGVKGIVDTMRKLIIVYEATTANTQTLKDLDAQCQRLLDIVINPLKSKPESDFSPEFQKIIGRLESRLLELLSDLHKPQPHKLMSIIDNEDIALALKDVNNKITQHVDFFMLEAHILGLLSQERALRKLEKHALDESIQKLPRANAGYDSYLSSTQNRSVCFPNTRQQLLGEIIEWMTSTDSTKPSMYILGGIAVRTGPGFVPVLLTLR